MKKFSYELTILPDRVNKIVLEAGSLGERLGLKISVGETIVDIDEMITGKKKLLSDTLPKKKKIV